MKPRVDFLQGTLDMLILKALSREPQHGYGIARWIERVTDDELKVEEGSLYPAVHRLEKRGLVAARWGHSENNRRAKFYRLTAKGRRQLRSETVDWKRFTAAVSQVLQAR